MSARQVAVLVEYGIMLLAGLYALALGRRWVGKKPGVDPKYDRWHASTGKHLAWLGPLVCLFAIFMLVEKLGR